MILLAFMLLQAIPQESTAQEVAFCSSQNDQPERFCLADRKHERAERELTAALAAARTAALNQRHEIERFSREAGGVTLEGDPVEALETSQQAWDKFYRADCEVIGLAVATGNAGTEGVTSDLACEADRIFDRVRFLDDAFSTGR